MTTGLEASEFFLIGEGGSTTMAGESVSSMNWMGGCTGLWGECTSASVRGKGREMKV